MYSLHITHTQIYTYTNIIILPVNFYYTIIIFPHNTSLTVGGCLSVLPPAGCGRGQREQGKGRGRTGYPRLLAGPEQTWRN